MLCQQISNQIEQRKERMQSLSQNAVGHPNLKWAADINPFLIPSPECEHKTRKVSSFDNDNSIQMSFCGPT